MKTVAALALAAAALCMPVIVSPVMADDAVSLVGTWSGQRERMAKVEGWRDGVATLVITEQKGMTFKGHLSRANPDGAVDEGLWGAFTPGGRLMVGSDEEGIYSFDLVDADTLDYCYVEAGASPRAVCARLTRQK